MSNSMFCIQSCKVNFGENGRPCVQTLTSSLKTFPKLYTPQELTGDAVRKDKTRLRLFSGTANPTLSQVCSLANGQRLACHLLPS